MVRREGCGRVAEGGGRSRERIREKGEGGYYNFFLDFRVFSVNFGPPHKLKNKIRTTKIIGDKL